MERLTQTHLAANYGNWSPDGQHIIFTSNSERRFGQIFRMSLADRQVERLTRTRSNYGDVSYSPDGVWLLYTRFSRWQTSVYRMRVDGSDVQLLSEHDDLDTMPQWFPMVDMPMRTGWMFAMSGLIFGVGFFVRRPPVFVVNRSGGIFR